MIYKYVAKEILFKIFLGEYMPGQKLPSIRNLANEYDANLNTIQRAMNILKKDNLIITRSTIGYYVTTDINLIEKTRIDYIKKLDADYQAEKIRLTGGYHD